MILLQFSLRVGHGGENVFDNPLVVVVKRSCVHTALLKKLVALFVGAALSFGSGAVSGASAAESELQTAGGAACVGEAGIAASSGGGSDEDKSDASPASGYGSSLFRLRVIAAEGPLRACSRMVVATRWVEREQSGVFLL